MSGVDIIITSRETGQHIERWHFDVRLYLRSSVAVWDTPADKLQITVTDEDGKNCNIAGSRDEEHDAPIMREMKVIQKTETEVEQEIQSLFRQIAASVTFLPILDGEYTFNVMICVDANSKVPQDWVESETKEITNAEEVLLRSFFTSSHQVGTVVSYRYGLLKNNAATLATC